MAETHSAHRTGAWARAQGECVYEKGAPGQVGLPATVATKILPNAITGCWEWIGARDSRGYVNVKIAGRVRKAHVVVYEALRGAIPSGRECAPPSAGFGVASPRLAWSWWPMWRTSAAAPPGGSPGRASEPSG